MKRRTRWNCYCRCHYCCCHYYCCCSVMEIDVASVGFVIHQIDAYGLPSNVLPQKNHPILTGSGDHPQMAKAGSVQQKVVLILLLVLGQKAMLLLVYPFLCAPFSQNHPFYFSTFSSHITQTFSKAVQSAPKGSLLAFLLSLLGAPTRYLVYSLRFMCNHHR
uniref:Uncharacterized protein n=1 Tax=Lutzomyia longipalpis TaxID=7200 RepID=A0A7G3B226_LUTLO